MTADDCIFCAIVRGSAAHRVLEAPDVVAFLDARPVFKGHTLVVPRRHVATLRDLPVDLFVPMLDAVQQVMGAVEAGLGADGSFVAVNNVVSQSVAHLHVHVVPRRRNDGLRGFFWPRTHYVDEAEAAQVAAAIRAALPGPAGPLQSSSRCNNVIT